MKSFSSSIAASVLVSGLQVVTVSANTFTAPTFGAPYYFPQPATGGLTVDAKWSVTNPGKPATLRLWKGSLSNFTMIQTLSNVSGENTTFANEGGYSWQLVNTSIPYSGPDYCLQLLVAGESAWSDYFTLLSFDFPDPYNTTKPNITNIGPFINQAVIAGISTSSSTRSSTRTASTSKSPSTLQTPNSRSTTSIAASTTLIPTTTSLPSTLSSIATSQSPLATTTVGTAQATKTKNPLDPINSYYLGQTDDSSPVYGTKTGVRTGTLVGAIIGSILGLLLVVFIAYMIHVRRKLAGKGTPLPSNNSNNVKYLQEFIVPEGNGEPTWQDKGERRKHSEDNIDFGSGAATAAVGQPKEPYKRDEKDEIDFITSAV